MKQSKLKDTTPLTDIVSGINITGNIISPFWYKNICSSKKTKHGTLSVTCDILAVNILADIVYWYRNSIVRNEQSGEIVSIKKKFKADFLQRSYDQIAEYFNVPKQTAKDAVNFLKALGLIKVHFRVIRNEGLVMSNVMFIEIVPDVLIKFSNNMDTTTTINTYHVSQLEGGGVCQLTHIGGIELTHTYTENTTKNTTKTSSKISKSPSPREEEKSTQNTQPSADGNGSPEAAADSNLSVSTDPSEKEKSTRKKEKELSSLIITHSKLTKQGHHIKDTLAIHLGLTTPILNFFALKVPELHSQGYYIRKNTNNKFVMLENTHLSVEDAQRLLDIHLKKAKEPVKNTVGASKQVPTLNDKAATNHALKTLVNESKQFMEDLLSADEFKSLCLQNSSLLSFFSMYKFEPTEIDFHRLYNSMLNHYSDANIQFRSKANVINTALNWINTLSNCKRYVIIEYFTFALLFPTFNEYHSAFPSADLANYSFIKSKLANERLTKQQFLDLCNASLINFSKQNESKTKSKSSAKRGADACDELDRMLAQLGSPTPDQWRQAPDDDQGDAISA